MKRKLMLFFATWLAVQVYAENENPEQKKIDIVPFGGAQYSILQFGNTTVAPSRDYQADSLRMIGFPMHTINGSFGLRVGMGERIKLKFGYQAQIWHELLKSDQPMTKKLSSGISECRADFQFGSLEQPPVQVAFGYFKYRYAPEAQDLGEYLFNSGCYPGFVFSGWEGANLLGVQTRVNAMEHFTHDIFLTTELFIIPAFDFSVSYIGHFIPGDMFTIGAGVMFNRLITIKETNTTPPKPVYNPADPSETAYYFTHRGIKVMGRAVFDPKPLFGKTKLGKEDLKLYAEAAILGVENYPYLYEDITERVPVMVGLHLPAFNIVDILAAECEWYGSPHRNNPNNYESSGYAIPEGRFSAGDEDDIKWAVTARKNILDGFSVMGRVASDHIRLKDGTGWVRDEQERTIAPDQWYWTLELKFEF